MKHFSGFFGWLFAYRPCLGLTNSLGLHGITFNTMLSVLSLKHHTWIGILPSQQSLSAKTSHPTRYTKLAISKDTFIQNYVTNQTRQNLEAIGCERYSLHIYYYNQLKGSAFSATIIPLIFTFIHIPVLFGRAYTMN